MYSVKGLEFKGVIIIGLNDGIIPLIRFPDLAGNIIRKYYGMGFNNLEVKPKSEFERWLVELYTRISAMSLRLSSQRGGYDYGIYDLVLAKEWGFSGTALDLENSPAVIR